LIVGLVVLGWWLFPVEWTDAAPSDLHPGYQDWWMRMSIISYGATGDAATAKVEYDALGEFAADTLATVKSNPGNIDPNLITQYEAAVNATAPPPADACPITRLQLLQHPDAGRTDHPADVMCVVTLLVGAAIVVYCGEDARMTSWLHV
jgi:hypothetical protein